LFLRWNYPMAIVEAKADYKQPGDGLPGKVDAMKASQVRTQAHFAPTRYKPRQIPRCWVNPSEGTVRGKWIAGRIQLKALHGDKHTL
jgi:hypothetical protein